MDRYARRILDLDQPNWLPLNDPVNQLVHTEDGTTVVSVMIGGRMILDNRRLVGVDVARLSTQVEAARERLAAAKADNRRHYQALEPIVGSHCPGMARLPYHIQRYAAPLIDLLDGLAGTVDDCAKVVEFLATDLSDYVTGAAIPIDGGWFGGGPAKGRATESTPSYPADIHPALLPYATKYGGSRDSKTLNHACISDKEVP
jgi:hypothetical protein